MKAELLNCNNNGLVPLSSVSYKQFARDNSGNIYFAPASAWYVFPANGKHPHFLMNGETYDLMVTPLPYGTSLLLTSTKD